MSPDHYRYGAYVAARMMQKALLKLRRSWKAEPGDPNLSAMAYLRQAAEPLGIECRDLGYDAFELRHGDRVMRFQAMASELENAVTYWLTGHKYMTFELLRRAGVSELPRYGVYSLQTAEDARRDFRQRGCKVVVKPCFGTACGQGVTVGISTEGELNRAIYAALCFDRQYLLEDFVEGENFRLLVSAGRLISAVRRMPASVTGDGVATLRELIERENTRRSTVRGLSAMYPIPVDDELRHHLRSCGMSLRTIPGRGERVFVKSVANFHAGGETEDVTESVCPDTIDLCRRVTAELRIALAGIDIITRDIRRPLRETGGAINEVNTSPGLDLHYAARNGMKRDVAREVLLDMFPSARPAPETQMQSLPS